MKFAHTILYVKDVPAIIEFYERAFGFQTKFITPENDYEELQSGETTLAFASYDLGTLTTSLRMNQNTTYFRCFWMSLRNIASRILTLP